MVGWVQVDMLGRIQDRRGRCCRRKGEEEEKVKRKLDSPPVGMSVLKLGVGKGKELTHDHEILLLRGSQER